MTLNKSQIPESCLASVSGSTFVNADCFDVFPFIEDKSIDAIICDLPYGMTKNNWDSVLPIDKLWKEYNRIIKDNGAIILFGNQPFSSTLIVSNLKMFRYSLVWEKNKFSDFLNAKRKPMKTNEDILIFYKKQPTYNIQYWYGEPYKRWNTQEAVDKQTNYGNHKLNVSESKDGKRLPTTVLKFNRVERPSHPTEKPVELLEWLIKSYTNEGDMVLDNTMGSGTCGLASIKNNRKFIGIEKEKQYYDVAVRRALKYLGNDTYKNIQEKVNYDKLLSSGMFWEVHPELSGNWDVDREVVQYCH